jgi:hypothetical protein
MSDTKVVTGEIRASYVSVFEPRLNDLSGKEEYSLVALIPKKDKETITDLKAAMEAAKEKKFGNKIPSGLQSPIHDGDGSKPNGGEYTEECHGHWVLNVKSNYQPGVVDTKVRPVMDQGEFQSGDYCRVSLNAYAYDNKRKGVSFGLNNVQVLRKGDPLGGHSAATDDFGAVETADEAEADF